MSLTGVTVSELPELNRSDVLMDDYIPILDMHSGDLKKLRIGGTDIIRGVCDTDASIAAKTLLLYDISYIPQVGDIFQIQFTAGNDSINPTLDINGTGVYEILFHGQSGNYGGMHSLSTCNALIKWTGSNYELIATDALVEVANAAHASTADYALQAAHASTADYVLDAAHSSTADYALDAAHASTADISLNSQVSAVTLSIPVNPSIIPTMPGSIWLEII